MFASIAVAIAFVLGTLVDKILFLLTVMMLWAVARSIARRIRTFAKSRWAALKHRVRHIFGPTLIIRP